VVVSRFRDLASVNWRVVCAFVETSLLPRLPSWQPLSAHRF
jgi:hypothetical protein